MNEGSSVTYATLTSLRGLACFMIVIFHCEQARGFQLIPDTPILSVRQFFAHGYMWVDLFFVLSGYMLTIKYAVLFRDRFSPAAYMLFLRRRFARTYPMYLVTLGAAYLGFVLVPNRHDILWPTELFTAPTSRFSRTLLWSRSGASRKASTAPAGH
jgi:peptidoglycan/LPS O-acetylase OafA/YrhL